MDISIHIFFNLIFGVYRVWTLGVCGNNWTSYSASIMRKLPLVFLSTEDYFEDWLRYVLSGFTIDFLRLGHLAQRGIALSFSKKLKKTNDTENYMFPNLVLFNSQLQVNIWYHKLGSRKMLVCCCWYWVHCISISQFSFNNYCFVLTYRNNMNNASCLLRYTTLVNSLFESWDPN